MDGWLLIKILFLLIHTDILNNEFVIMPIMTFEIGSLCGPPATQMTYVGFFSCVNALMLQSCGPVHEALLTEFAVVRLFTCEIGQI